MIRIDSSVAIVSGGGRVTRLAPDERRDVILLVPGDGAGIVRSDCRVDRMAPIDRKAVNRLVA